MSIPFRSALCHDRVAPDPVWPQSNEPVPCFSFRRDQRVWLSEDGIRRRRVTPFRPNRKRNHWL